MQSVAEYNGAKITVEGQTTRVKFKTRMYQRVLGLSEIRDMNSELDFYALFFLAHISKVEGSLGFDVPIGTADKQALQVFIENFLSADEALMEALDSAISQASVISNDSDLLPPSDVDPKN